MAFIVCQHCGNRMIPRADGTCPSCQKQAALEAIVEPAAAEQQAKCVREPSESHQIVEAVAFWTPDHERQDDSEVPSSGAGEPDCWEPEDDLEDESGRAEPLRVSLPANPTPPRPALSPRRVSSREIVSAVVTGTICCFSGLVATSEMRQIRTSLLGEGVDAAITTLGMGLVSLGICAYSGWVYYHSFWLRDEDRRASQALASGAALHQDIGGLLDAACAREVEGDWTGAIEVYQVVATSCQGQPDGAYAENCIEKLRERMPATAD
jgi:hypothetical protein